MLDTEETMQKTQVVIVIIIITFDYLDYVCSCRTPYGFDKNTVKP